MSCDLSCCPAGTGEQEPWTPKDGDLRAFLFREPGWGDLEGTLERVREDEPGSHCCRGLEPRFFHVPRENSIWCRECEALDGQACGFSTVISELDGSLTPCWPEGFAGFDDA